MGKDHRVSEGHNQKTGRNSKVLRVHKQVKSID